MAETPVRLRGKSDEDWKKRWVDGLTDWHKNSVEPVLQRHVGLLGKLDAAQPLSVLVTMCGKSLDLLWLSELGYKVTGAEISDIAAKAFFDENNVPYTLSDAGLFKVYTAKDRPLRFLVGSVFDLSEEMTGLFDAIWDHNALVAVNVELRERYVTVLASVLKQGGKILMGTWEYDQREHDSNPYSISTPAIKDWFGALFSVEVVEFIDFTGTRFTEKFKLTWAKKPVHLLVKK